MEILRKMFSTILDMKNANRAQKMFLHYSTKDRMIYFNIYVAVKHRRVN